MCRQTLNDRNKITALYTDKQTRNIDNNSNTWYHKTKYINEQSVLYAPGRARSGASSRVKNGGSSGLCGRNSWSRILLWYRAEHSKGWGRCPECSLTIPLGLHIIGPGNSNERPSCEWRVRGGLYAWTKRDVFSSYLVIFPVTLSTFCQSGSRFGFSEQVLSVEMI